MMVTMKMIMVMPMMIAMCQIVMAMAWCFDDNGVHVEYWCCWRWWRQ